MESSIKDQYQKIGGRIWPENESGLHIYYNEAEQVGKLNNGLSLIEKVRGEKETIVLSLMTYAVEKCFWNEPAP